MRRTILIVSPYYHPGIDAGGPVKSLKNLSRLLLRDHTVKVITKDRDLGAAAGFAQVVPEQWNETAYGTVYYSSSLGSTMRNLRAACASGSGDTPLVYLNSFFSFRFSILPIVLRKLHLIAPRELLIAPRGEFAPGALAHKPLRKRVYLALARLTGLYRGVLWHATNEEEASFIRARFGARARLRVAVNLSGMVQPAGAHPVKQPNLARIAFVARIVRIKNLHFALATLAGVKGEVRFDIYGPQEDPAYWRECQDIITRLPGNITVNWLGVLGNEAVCEALAGYDLFYLPTQGENFGHSIIEALQAGCPVLISDRTPWRRLEAAGVGWDLPLDNPAPFTAAVEAVVAMDAGSHEAYRARTATYLASHALLREAEAQNLSLFR